jgi:hypothetical protein
MLFACSLKRQWPSQGVKTTTIYPDVVGYGFTKDKQNLSHCPFSSPPETRRKLTDDHHGADNRDHKFLFVLMRKNAS